MFSMAFPSSDRPPYAAAGRTMEAVEVIRWAVLIQRLACLRSLEVGGDTWINPARLGSFANRSWCPATSPNASARPDEW